MLKFRYHCVGTPRELKRNQEETLTYRNRVLLGYSWKLRSFSLIFSLMSKIWLPLLLGLLFATAAVSQQNSQSFTELNLGIAALDGYGISDFEAPGGSLMFGMIKQPSENFVVECQIGAAYATAKVSAGIGTLNKNVMLSCRPWPLMIGPQFKRSDWTFSVEFGTTNSISFDAGTIATVGYRMSLDRKDKPIKTGAVLRPLKTITAASIIGLFIAGSTGISDVI